MANLPDLPAVVDSLKQIVDEPDLDPNKSLSELGVDSLDLLEWLHVLEDEYGLELSDETVASVDQSYSVAEVYQTLCAAIAAPTPAAASTPADPAPATEH